MVFLIVSLFQSISSQIANIYILVVYHWSFRALSDPSETDPEGDGMRYFERDA